MKFKVRETTDYLHFIKKNTGGLSALELRKEARRTGKLDVDYHYVIQENGSIEQGRDPHAVAGYSLANCDNSLYVLVDTGERGRVSDAQKITVKNLIESTTATYPSIKIVQE